MKTYTICLVGLEKQKAAVIGGGSVALRKVSGLREAGCQVTVISPELTGGLYDLQSSGQIHWVEKSYQPGDLRTLGLGPNSLVIAATDRPEINRQAWEEALQLGCLINVADDPEHSNFILPAVVRRGELTLAVSTGGASPAMARWLRQELEAQYGEEFGMLASVLGDLRPDLIAMFESEEERRKAAFQIIESGILDVIRRQGEGPARAYAASFLKNLQASHRNERDHRTGF
ncbi:MAG: bifunctional precorrin-2 dehydrogenase/sirohydrochlorin ferrochelatase [Chloroflexi bacterium]|nr:bifunctional precorrin-2 dehydrogenase/sirohydrochlorin ferrochelatase [Chloroflexota bacterium]